MDADAHIIIDVQLRCRELDVASERIEAFARTVLTAESYRTGNVDICITDDEEIAAVNREHLGHEGPTDVISFDLGTKPAPHRYVDGEVIVSAQRARQEAERRGIPADQELLRYVAHGLLHLVGYDDGEPDERNKMWARQEQLLETATPSPGKGRLGIAGTCL